MGGSFAEVVLSNVHIIGDSDAETVLALALSIVHNNNKKAIRSTPILQLALAFPLKNKINTPRPAPTMMLCSTRLAQKDLPKLNENVYVFTVSLETVPGEDWYRT